MSNLMKAVGELTIPEKLLTVAEQLPQPFGASALVVAAWQKFPLTFGLSGYNQLYPDSNRVLSSLMGEKGLVRRGWFIQPAQKTYALTKDGRSVLRRLAGEDEPEGPSVDRLPRVMDGFVAYLLQSTAVEKFEENRKAELTFADACRFWGITEAMRGEQLDDKLSIVQKNLADLDRFFAESDAELTSGRVLTAGDIRVLTNIHRHMEDRFKRHLNLLRSRTAKRAERIPFPQAHRE